MGHAEPPNPVAMTTIMRGDILKENETLTRYVNHKLQQFKLHGSPSLHSLRRDPTPYDSGMPRAPASTHGSLSRYNLDQMTAPHAIRLYTDSTVNSEVYSFRAWHTYQPQRSRRQ